MTAVQARTRTHAGAAQSAKPDAATARIADLLLARTGQDMLTSRAWRIDSALQPLLRERGFADLGELAAALAENADGQLPSAIVDVLLNQETSFFRDAGVIELAADALAARIVADPARRPRLWSAGCSLGQEAYSLAILLAERGQVADIVATDVSERAVARARAARYSQFEIQRGLSVHRMLKWFAQDGDDWVADRALARRVTVRRQNLVADPPPYGLFDVILCRNVLYYLAPATRRTVFARLADALRPGGLLILGAGETTIGQTERFIPSRAYRGAYDLAPSG